MAQMNEHKRDTAPEDCLKIHSLESFGTHDGPGIRFVVFTQGCEFKCLYCHNPDTIATDKNAGGMIPLEEIVRHVRNQIPYFADNGGITISGGEPLLHAATLTRLFTTLKKDNIHTVIDTNGGILNDAVKKLLELTDLVLLDVKHIDPRAHLKLTGRPIDPTLEFADYLREIKKPMWLRYVLVPGLSDSEENLEKFGQHFRDFENIALVEILPYHKLGVHKWASLGWKYELEGIEPPTTEALDKAKHIFEKYFKQVRIN